MQAKRARLNGWLLLSSALFGLSSVPCRAESVNVNYPATVNFNVRNISATTLSGSTTVSYTSASINNKNRIRISVKARAASFTPPVSGATTWAPGDVTFTVAGASFGTVTPGTLTLTTAYQQIYLSEQIKNTTPDNDSITINWTLAAKTTIKWSGNHTLLLDWKTESVP